MTTNNRSDLPLYRVSFSRITGKDGDGNDILARPKEIGAIWPRKGNKAGGILNFELMPIELAQRQGVTLVVPVERDAKEGSQ